MNPVDVGYTEDGGIYAGVFLVDSLLPFGVISGDSLQAISEQQAEEAAEDTAVLEEAQEIVDSDEEETEEEPLTADEKAESDGVEEAESVAEPVLTESETESAAEPVLTESGTESAAEPVLTDSETESIAEPVLEEVIEYPAQSFKGSTENVVVTVLAPEGAFPADTTMVVEDALDSVVNDITDAVSDGSKTVNKVHAVDITFKYSNGNEIEPLVPVKVTITAEEKQTEEETLVVHVSDEGNVEQVEDAVVSERNGESSARLTMEAVAEEFSVYAIVYTVDFSCSVNGKMYDFSLPGLAFLSMIALFRQ